MRKESFGQQWPLVGCWLSVSQSLSNGGVILDSIAIYYIQKCWYLSNRFCTLFLLNNHSDYYIHSSKNDAHIKIWLQLPWHTFAYNILVLFTTRHYHNTEYHEDGTSNWVDIFHFLVYFATRYVSNKFRCQPHSLMTYTISI